MAAQGDLECEAELEAAKAGNCPALALHVWGWFVELSQTRTSSGFGANPLTRAEIRLWEEDEGHKLERWERRAILALDAAWRASLAAEEDDSGGEEAPNG